MNDDDNIEGFLLSCSRALLDHISINLRAVFIDPTSNGYELIFYYNERPCEDEAELANLADTEMIADFPHLETDFIIRSLKYPTPIPKMGEWAYKRYEEGDELRTIEENPFKEADQIPSYANILLSGQKALLGRITPNLRAVQFIAKDSQSKDCQSIELFFNYDKAPSDLERTLVELAKAKIVADFSHLKISSLICNVSYPENLPRRSSLYFRYEGPPLE
jgi:hypothetical protein